MFGHKRTGIQTAMLNAMILPTSGAHGDREFEPPNENARIERLMKKEKYIVGAGFMGRCL